MKKRFILTAGIILFFGLSWYVVSIPRSRHAPERLDLRNRNPKPTVSERGAAAPAPSSPTSITALDATPKPSLPGVPLVNPLVAQQQKYMRAFQQPINFYGLVIEDKSGLPIEGAHLVLDPLDNLATAAVTSQPYQIE